MQENKFFEIFVYLSNVEFKCKNSDRDSLQPVETTEI